MTSEIPNYYKEAVEIQAEYQNKLREGQLITEVDEVAFTVALWIIQGYKKRMRDERNQSVHQGSSD